MDVRTARWMQVVRFTDEQLRKIHDLEKDSGSDWWIRGSYLFDHFNLDLGPFWSKSRTEPERAMEVERFEKRIYPLWAPRYRRHSMGEISEIDWVHSADKAIHAACIPIDTGFGGKAERSFQNAY